MFAILMLQDGIRILLMVSSIFVDISIEFEIVILR